MRPTAVRSMWEALPWRPKHLLKLVPTSWLISLIWTTTYFFGLLPFYFFFLVKIYFKSSDIQKETKLFFFFFLFQSCHIDNWLSLFKDINLTSCVTKLKVLKLFFFKFSRSLNRVPVSNTEKKKKLKSWAELVLCFLPSSSFTSRLVGTKRPVLPWHLVIWKMKESI